MRTPRRRVRAVARVATLTLTACYDDVKVVQGTVTAVDAGGRALAVRDERPPHATSTFGGVSVAAVTQGDLVRLAYRDLADGKQVVRLMNLTRHQARERGAQK
jgi:hypothetical protein